MEFGKHCSYQYCRQKDYLPFTCGGCSKTYCLEHREANSHECENKKLERKAVVCPICNKTLPYQTTLSADEIWEIHSATDCGQVQATVVKTCPVKNCRTELKTINTHSCKNCQQDVCLKHRMPENHDCSTMIKAPQRQINNQMPMYNFNNGYNQNILHNPWK